MNAPLEISLKELVLRHLREHSASRSASGIVPRHMPMADLARAVQADLKAALNELVAAGSVKWTRTLNDTCFEPCD